MSKELKVTPLELFVLGEQMQAKYYEYQYLAAMQDIKNRYHSLSMQAYEDLETKEILEMDFSGEMEIAEDAKELLSPVFFGETETQLKTDTKTFYFHLMNGQVVMGVIENKEIIFKKVQKSDIARYLTGDGRIQHANVTAGLKEVYFTSQDLKDENKWNNYIKMLMEESL